MIKKCLLLISLALSLNSFSGPGVISQMPLGMQNTIPANLMLLQDSSGSMNFDLEQQCLSDYECDRAYKCGNRYCPRDLYYVTRGDASYSQNSFGFESDFTTGYDYYGEFYYQWGERRYYNCQKLNTPQIKTCISSRKYMASREAQKLIDKVDGFYTGVMRFNSNNQGGIVVNDLTLLDSETQADYVQRQSSIKEKIRQIPAPRAGTPLSESLAALGHYFTYAVNSVPTVSGPIASPSGSLPGQKNISDVFSSNLLTSWVGLPSYGASGKDDKEKNKNMAMKGWCQRNFAIALTDGEPSSNDNPVTELLRNYEVKGSTDYLMQVAGALWDMDLRPDLCDPLLLDDLNEEFDIGMTKCSDLLTTKPSGEDRTIYQILESKVSLTANDNLVVNDGLLHRYKNNIRTYLIGFGPVSGSTAAKNLMEKSAQAGAGEFFPAKDGAALESVFAQILNTITAVQASSSGQGISLSPGSDGFLFQSEFDSASWSGVIEKYPIVRGAVAQRFDENTRVWSTNDEGTFPVKTTPSSDGVCTFQDNRVVISYDNKNHTGISFRWNTLLSDHPIKVDLSIGEDGNTDTLGDERLLYLRGDQCNEFQNNATIGFRDRQGILGDIISSTPTFVGSIPEGQVADAEWVHPNLVSRWNDSIMEYTNDQKYVSPKRNKNIVYVNANDGMLHAFEEDGEKIEEVFAYMPSYVASNEHKKGLHYLTDKKYQHQFYNDGTAWVKEDVYLDDKWRTLLISTAGAGAKGLSLLDITDIDTASTDEADADDIVLWEFTHPELGYTFPEPYIGLFRNGMWGIVIGNGYHSKSGEAMVFILNVEPNLGDGQWDEGSDYFIIKTGVGQADDTQGWGKNGMSTVVAADVFQDPEDCISERAGLRLVTADSCRESSDYFYPGYGTIDRLYGGDLYGNVWAFNLISSDPDEWEVDFNHDNQAGAKTPFFTVPLDAKRKPQPITAPVRLSWAYPIIRCDGPKSMYLNLYRDIDQSALRKVLVGAEFGDQSVIPFKDWNFTGIDIPYDDEKQEDADDSKMFQSQLTCGPNILVAIGTGQYLTEADVVDDTKRAFYVVWDNYKSPKYPLTISNLDKRLFGTATYQGEAVRTISDDDGLADGEFHLTQFHEEKEFGWYVNFDQPGERVVHAPFLARQTHEIMFASIIPEDEMCGAGGRSILHRLDILGGGAKNDYRIPKRVNDHGVIGMHISSLSYGMTYIGSGLGADGVEYAATSLSGGGGGAYKPDVITFGDRQPRGVISNYELEQ